MRIARASDIPQPPPAAAFATTSAMGRVGGKTLALLSALYFVEGVPWGFQSQALPIFYRVHGESLTKIGFLSALSLPWMIKALWAPLVDRYGWKRFGRRKSWIIPMQIGLLLACLAGAQLAANEDLRGLLFVVFAMNLFSATMDIAVDALAVDVLREHELGTGNITQVVGYKAGSLVSGGLLVWATSRIGWPGLFLGMASLVFVVTVATLIAREPKGHDHTPDADHAKGPTLREIVTMMRAALCKPGTAAFFAFVATYKTGEQLVDAMFKPFLLDAGFAAPKVGLWVSTFGMAASLIGSFLGGLLASRWALLRAVTWTAVLRLIPLLAVVALTFSRPSPAAVILTTVAEHFFGGLLTTATFAFMMARTDRRMGATHYTMIATVEMLGKAPVPIFAGKMADKFGYSVTFAAGAFISGLFLLLLIPLHKTRDVPSEAVS